ncbi:hypothetical protein HK102_002671 [Quaeritorhiza haematococci]|nr:hypothetical protein HK102_002671 [Quaeritorhiza haematococci]
MTFGLVRGHHDPQQQQQQIKQVDINTAINRAKTTRGGFTARINALGRPILRAPQGFLNDGEMIFRKSESTSSMSEGMQITANGEPVRASSTSSSKSTESRDSTVPIVSQQQHRMAPRSSSSKDAVDDANTHTGPIAASRKRYRTETSSSSFTSTAIKKVKPNPPPTAQKQPVISPQRRGTEKGIRNRERRAERVVTSTADSRVSSKASTGVFTETVPQIKTSVSSKSTTVPATSTSIQHATNTFKAAQKTALVCTASITSLDAPPTQCHQSHQGQKEAPAPREIIIRFKGSATGSSASQSSTAHPTSEPTQKAQEEQKGKGNARIPVNKQHSFAAPSSSSSTTASIPQAASTGSGSNRHPSQQIPRMTHPSKPTTEATSSSSASLPSSSLPSSSSSSKMTSNRGTSVRSR